MPRREALPARSRVALLAERAAAGASRRLGRGSGEMIGGKVALRVAPDLLQQLGATRRIATVSGTNGKTTTTRLLAAALGTAPVGAAAAAAGRRAGHPGTSAPASRVVSNSGGANMTPGVLAALARSRPGDLAALEVDEIYLPAVAGALRPAVVCLLNITRDQLDRSNETRRIAALWRATGEALGAGTTAVANADDPLVVHAALGFAAVVWVGAGQRWTADALVCPRCAQLLRRAEHRWWCPACGLSRPEPTVTALAGPHPGGVPRWRVGTEVLAGPLALPGQVNADNAAVALAAAQALAGVDPARALAAMAAVTAVAGRYSTVRLAGRPARLLLAKNPAGWTEMLDLLAESPGRGVAIHFHARVADGRDPSWLWDVPLDRLAGHPVAVSGDRAHDVATRLAYAGVPHTVHADVTAAVAALPGGDQPVDVLATYTAFRELLG